MKRLIVLTLIALIACIPRQQIDIPSWVSDTTWYEYETAMYEEAEAREWDSLVTLYPNLTAEDAYEQVYKSWDRIDWDIFYRAWGWYDDTGCLDPSITWSGTLELFRKEYGKSFPERAHEYSILLDIVEDTPEPRKPTPEEVKRWPTPEEVRQDLGIDPLEVVTLVVYEPLDSADIATLEAKRLAYFEAMMDSFPDMSRRWWATSMCSWISNTYDSLQTAGKSAEAYCEHLFNLRAKNWRNWFVMVRVPGDTTDRYLASPEADSLKTFTTSIGFYPPQP